MATPVPLLVAGALLAGGAAGVAAESAGFSPVPEPDADEVVEEPGVVLGDGVAVHDCPDGPAIAVLASGDGVIATGRTEDGLWIEIRSPLDVTTAAWMTAGALDPAGDLESLPVHECAVEATTTTGSITTTSTTSTSTTSTTTTTVPGETTTVLPTTTPRPPTTIPQTTVQDAPPAVGTPVASVPTIETLNAANGPCAPLAHASSAQISAPVSDDSAGELLVTMTVRTISSGNVISTIGPVPMALLNGQYRANLGPLPQSAAGSNAGPPTVAEVTVRAQDSAGNVDTATSNGPVVVRCP